MRSKLYRNPSGNRTRMPTVRSVPRSSVWVKPSNPALTCAETWSTPRPSLPAWTGRLGLGVDQVSAQVSAGLLGLTQTELRGTDRTVGIRVRFPDGFRYNFERIRDFPILTPAHQYAPLSALAQ